MTNKAKYEAKQKVNQEFGFQINKIELLEVSGSNKYEFDYIMFAVCGIAYQAQRYYDNGVKWSLGIYND